jgi:hypothetical protein
VLIPVAGSIAGANSTFFRSDLSITNRSPLTPAGATLRFRTGDGQLSTSLDVSLPPGATRLFTDVVGGALGKPGSLGHIVVEPTSGSISVTSRTYNTLSNGATNGTAVPAVPLSRALAIGQKREFGGIRDSSLESITGAAPGTFRTNFGLVETSGKPATVRVTVGYVGTAGGFSASVLNGSIDISLSPYQSVLVSRISSAALGSARDVNFKARDMDNLRVDFDIIRGNGAVVPFLTSTDNGTGDTLLIVE